MSSIIRKNTLNTFEDNRWNDFQRGARKRRMIAIASTITFAVISWMLQSILPLLLGEIILWLSLKLWLQIKVKK
ncbi:hypothetical protein SD81_012180 [Tolypothrix campylonemoides VB511288]|nr:hypothetical protein SD81_012180 [Tolypothrix campylonemoides VB511288]